MQDSGNQARKAGALCCICKEGIDFEIDADGVATNPTGFDPCTLCIVTNGLGEREGQREQWFYCHMECFRRMVNSDELMYILEPDYSTVGEGERALEEEEKAAEAAWSSAKVDLSRLDQLVNRPEHSL